MLCHQARKRLNKSNWCYGDSSQDQELLEHVKSCRGCYSLVLAEEALRSDINTLRQAEPRDDLLLETIRHQVESAASPSAQSRDGGTLVSKRRTHGLTSGSRYGFAAGIVVVLFALVAFVPFRFRENIGYEISIGGVEKSIALDNKKITSLLSALGMEENKASTLLDTTNLNNIRLHVGECEETCHLRISDLKTERDVRLVVDAIIQLGCCQIDNIAPIFRDESMSLLRLAARKLLS